jgi:hypothetical protein
MKAAHTLPENLIYGIQLWKLNCLYFDGHNYRFSRHHSAVEPAMRGRIAVPVNQALKHRFADPTALYDYAHSVNYPQSAKGTAPPMQSSSANLSALLPIGSDIYTVVMRESRTGGSCHLLVLIPAGGKILSVTAAAADLLNLPTQHGQIGIESPRARAGAMLTSQLALALHQDVHALRHQSLG